jgi:acyl-ACP thioesterase
VTGFTPDPPSGRVYHAGRLVRGTDVTPAGQLRLDAIARYLQDVAEDDVKDAAWDEPQDWLLRRCELAIAACPARGEEVRLRTFCSGLGPRWAERTTTLAGPAGDLIQATALWVAIGALSGAPVPLSAEFRRIYGPSTQDRTVTSRLRHPAPGPDLVARPWPLRAADFDPAGHVNNSIAWAAAEDLLAGQGWRPARAEAEYHRQVLPGCEPGLAASHSPARLDAWLLAGTDRLASLRLSR